MRVNPHKRLYDSAAWKKRRRALLLVEPLCRLCAARGRVTAATVADHVVPHRGDLDLFYFGELAPLCKPCHDSAKQKQEHSGVLVGGDTNGDPLDPGHHWNRPKTT